MTLPDPALPPAAPRLSDAERSQRLDVEVDRYVRAGFHVVVHKSVYRMDLYMGPPDKKPPHNDGS